MSDHYIFVEDDVDIRQGDIIRRNVGTSETLGLILTADCDIAQKKTNDRFTWLEIVRADYYLENHWAAEQLRRLAEKQSIGICESLNAMIKISGNDLTALNTLSLTAWLETATPDEIVAAVSQGKRKRNEKLTKSLQAMKLVVTSDKADSRLKRLRQAWSLVGRDERTQQAAMREAFDSGRGFPDYVLVPELPGVAGYGFVILLRNIAPLPGPELFRSEVEARINGQPHSFYRIGRFSDSLRYSVAQKLAFLFSRIGMSTQYEDACNAAAALLIETVCNNGGETP